MKTNDQSSLNTTILSLIALNLLLMRESQYYYWLPLLQSTTREGWAGRHSNAFTKAALSEPLKCCALLKSRRLSTFHFNDLSKTQTASIYWLKGLQEFYYFRCLVWTNVTIFQRSFFSRWVIIRYHQLWPASSRSNNIQIQPEQAKIFFMSNTLQISP